MNRLIQIVFVSTSLAATPALGDNTPHCDALDQNGKGDISIDANLDFDDGDLVFREEGETLMMITEEGELFLRGTRIELDDRGHELAAQYYVSVEEFVNDAVDLAGDAAGLGVSAAVEALVAVFTGHDDMEKFEARVEARASEIEAQADRMCERFLRIEHIEREMQQRIPGFKPVMFASATLK